MKIEALPAKMKGKFIDMVLKCAKLHEILGSFSWHAGNIFQVDLSVGNGAIT